LRIGPVTLSSAVSGDITLPQQSLWAKSTYVLGTFCYPCLRVGHRKFGSPPSIRTAVHKLRVFPASLALPPLASLLLLLASCLRRTGLIPSRHPRIIKER
jgi:hypothetical protein